MRRSDRQLALAALLLLVILTVGAEVLGREVIGRKFVQAKRSDKSSNVVGLKITKKDDGCTFDEKKVVAQKQSCNSSAALEGDKRVVPTGPNPLHNRWWSCRLQAEAIEVVIDRQNEEGEEEVINCCFFFFLFFILFFFIWQLSLALTLWRWEISFFFTFFFFSFLFPFFLLPFNKIQCKILLKLIWNWWFWSLVLSLINEVLREHSLVWWHFFYIEFELAPAI